MYNSPFICTFAEYSEGTLVRKSPNKFGFSLTYLYLCTRLTHIVK